MSSQGNGQPGFYEVRLSEQTANGIKQQYMLALELGKGQQFLDALRIIRERLRTNPQQLGEPLFRLPVLKLLVFHGIVNPVVFDYGIHQERPLVFLRGVKLLQ
jgi:hypothetical protein